MHFCSLMPEVQRDPITSEIISAAIDIHRELGPGLLESAYLACLEHDLLKRGLRIERQVPVSLIHGGVRIDCGYRLDLLVNQDIIVEVKSVERLMPIHTAQVLTYLKLTGVRQALLINFNCLRLKDGLRSYLGSGNDVPHRRGSTLGGG